MQCCDDALRDIDRNANLRFDGRCAEMRRQHDVRCLEQRIALLCRRLARVDIDGSGCDDALLECLGKVRLIDDAAARAVDEANARLHLLHLLHRDHALRLLRQRHVHRDEIGVLDDLVERRDLDAERFGALFINIGIVGEHIHVEGHRALRHARADAAHADDTECLAAQLDADVLLAVPLALMHRLIGDRDIAGHREHHGHRVLRCRNRVAARGVDDDDALGRRGRDVDVVDADAGAADDLELLGTRDDFRRDLRGRAHDQCVEVRDDLEELLSRELVLDDDLEFLLQEFNAFRRNTICC